MEFGHRHPVGFHRREFLQVGFSGLLGLGMPQILGARAVAAGSPGGLPRALLAPRARSVIIVFFTGGMSHHDTIDMKPDAPEQIRGAFRPIETAAPGIHFCEHMPMLAARADKLAVVRSFSHGNLNHLNSTHLALTGQAQPGAFFDKIATRDDYPCYSAALDMIRPRVDGVPSGVNLPTYLMEGPLTWPGQHAGFLGPSHDPWQVRQDPNQAGFGFEGLALPAGLSVERLGRRRSLLDSLMPQLDKAATRADQDPYSAQVERAMTLLLSGKVARAFDLSAEDPLVRDRYGRHMFGQSLLLARRLVEAEVPVVQVNMGRVQTWDHHQGIFRALKDRLLPPTDRGVSALLDDLSSRGMLDQTLVVMIGEFGRTPKLGVLSGSKNENVGRDHWGAVFSGMFAGAGVQGGQIIGQSDKIGGYPASRPYTPADLAATIYRSLGVDPAVELRDRLNRPIRLCLGDEIAPLYSAASVG